jgi:hypothetical protein
MTGQADLYRIEIQHLRQLLNNATTKNVEYKNRIAELEAKIDVYHKNLEYEYRKTKL